MSYTFSLTVDPVEYDTFVENHEYCNLLQSSNWSKIKDNWGHLLTGLRNEKNELVAAALVLRRPVKFGWTVWYIPHGPILDFRNKEIVKTYFEHLIKAAKKGKCAFLKVDPPVFAHAAKFEEFEDVVDPEALEIRDYLESLGFRHQGFSKQMHETIQPRYQAVTFAEERALEQRISKKSRTAIKNSKKRMVDIQRASYDDLPDFYYLIEKTEEAKDINLRSLEYFQKLMNVYGDDCVVYLGTIHLQDAIDKHEQMKEEINQRIANLPANAPKKIVEYEGQLNSCDKFLHLFREMREKEGEKALIAGCLGVLYGNSFEILYAGFNRDYSFIPAQDPVFFASMNEAFSRGAKFVGMGGVEGDLKGGLMEYKSYFDPHVVAYLGEFDFPVNPLLYKVYRMIIK